MDLNKLMQQAQAMQRTLGKAQEQLEATLYTGETGGSEGVSVTINGRNEVQEIKISDELMGVDNKEMLQDMLLIAMNQAVEKASKDREEKLGTATQGFSIPGM